jgi:hypothetical protein
MRTHRPQAFFFLGFSALALFATSSVSAAGHDDAQIVRIRSVQGDVRLSSGGGKNPWVKAQADVPIGEGFSLATGEGRAEIEFEDSSIAYLAENSLLIFKDLSMENGVPDTRLELVTGTATLFVRPLPKESFVLETPTGEMNFPKPEFLRVDSYLDGAALTPEDGKGAEVRQPDSKLLHLAKGQTITFAPDGFQIDPGSVGQSASHDEWDDWVSARVNERVAATNAALQASGLTSPILGLADLYEQGNFFPCAPYGTCWEPREQVVYVCVPGYLPYSGESVDVFGNKTVYFPICNNGNFIYRQHRYAWVVGKRYHHPVHWIRVGNKEGFVPRHPNDERGKLPINLKYGFFVPSKKAGQEFERIDYDPSQKLTLLTEPPKAFRGERLPELPSAARPEIHASFVADRASGPKGTVIAGGQHTIGYDYKSKNFVLSNIDASGHASKPVALASFSSRGGSSGVYGGRGAGSAGGAGNSGSRGGGGGSGGGSHAGGGGSGASGSHGGGGGGSSGGGSGGGGGGGHPH